MNIKSLEIDFEKEVLRINGKDFKENAVIVTLPEADGWSTHKLFNIELASGIQEECDRLEIRYIRAKSQNTTLNKSKAIYYSVINLRNEMTINKGATDNRNIFICIRRDSNYHMIASVHRVGRRRKRHEQRFSYD